MKVLFTVAPQYRLIGGSCNFTGVGLHLLAETLRGYGIEAKVHNCDKSDDCNVLLDEHWLYFNEDQQMISNWNDDAFLDKVIQPILDFEPDVIGFYVYSSTVDYTKKMVDRIKQLSKKPVRFIAGGVHFRLNAPTKEDLRVFPAICTTEAENVIYDMLYHNGVYSQQPTDLNTLPVVTDEIFLDAGLDELSRMETSRGCPFSCTFCCATTLKTKIRFIKVDHIITEILFRMCLGIRDFVFSDELFVFNTKRLKELAGKLPKNLSITVETRVDSVNEERLDILKSMGCVKIKFGVEYGTQHQLDVTNKKATLQQCLDASKWTKERGIDFQTNHIIGCPECNEDIYMQELDFLESLESSWYSSAVLAPYRGTPLYEQVKHRITPDMEIQLRRGHFTNSNWFNLWGITPKVLERTALLNKSKKHTLEKVGSGVRQKIGD